MSINTRRLRRLYVNRDEVIRAVFGFGKDIPNFVQCVNWPTLPDDVTILEVHDDYMNLRFCFTLHSESFGEVPSGEIIPELEGTTFEDSKIETHEFRAFWKEGTDANPNIKRSLKKVAEAIWASTESNVEETAVEDAVQLIPEIE